ncbi:hypothetical protein LTR39_000199 [Cryomyces antarcticus]|nr:hypothetical protein LTR39_000199 [Cryomyces antarcticus]
MPLSPSSDSHSHQKLIPYPSFPVHNPHGSLSNNPPQISLHVLTTHLLASHTSHATVIDTAGAFDVLRLQKIAAQRLKAADGRPSNAHVHVDVGLSVDQMLERVKIMRVFDFVGLVEAVGEVREELESESAVHEAERGLHGRDHDATRPTVADGQDAEEMLMGDEPPTGPRDEAAGQQQQEQQTTTHQERYGMIIVDNITQVAAPIVKSNYIQVLIPHRLEGLKISVPPRLCHL